MYRFVACVWDVEEREAASHAAVITAQLRGVDGRWRITVDAPGLIVACIGDDGPTWQTYRVGGDGGVVLGTLFQRASDGVSRPSNLTFDDHEARTIIETGGEHLVRKYWGRYVAFLRDAVTQRLDVLRDPSGLLPCLTARVHTVHVYFSWLADAAKVGVSTSRLDPDYVRARLQSRLAYGRRTGLANVLQVLGGERIAHHRGKATRTLVWNPLEICEPPIDDREHAEAELRRVTQDVVQAWAGRYPSILHSLSGGLDSSIILACLRDVPAKITCLNVFTSEAAGDERALARLAARQAERELLERHHEATDVTFEALLQVPVCPEPIHSLGWLDHIQRDAPIAHELGACAIFSGLGGDEVFCRSGAAWAVSDYARRHGVRPSLFGRAMDAAQQEQLSVWQVLRAVLWGPRWEPRSEPGAIVQSLVSSVPGEDAGEHSALRSAPVPVACGKRRHAYLVTPLPPWFFDPITPPSVERIMPLRSQPLLELCLRIPTYTLVEDGWDRALARRAFCSDLPPEIVSRRTKGEVSGYMRGLLMKNLPFIQGLLLEGRLAKEGFVDRAQLASRISMARSRDQALLAQICDYIDIELWMRACSEGDVRHSTGGRIQSAADR